MFELAPFDLPADYGEGIVSLDDVKRQVAVELGETEFDELLGALRDAAVDMVERYCGVYLARREGVVWRAESLPRRLRLPGPDPVVTAFAYLDGDGADATFDVAALRVGRWGEVLPVAGQAWPGDIGGGIALTFTAGYDTPPPALVQAVKIFAAHLFAQRELAVTGTIVTEVPMHFKALCNAYRAVVI